MKIRKKWMRLFAVVLLLPLIVVVALISYIQLNQSEIIKSEIAKLNQSYKGRIDVGQSELALFSNFPYISMRIDDVKIFETKEQNAAIIMDVQDIYVGFDIWDILKGNYDLQSVIVENGILNIIIHEDNSTNIQNSLLVASENDAVSTNIHLKRVKFKNLDIHTLDEATNTDVEKYIYEGAGGFRQKDSLISGHIDTEFELNVIKNGDTTFIKNKHFEIHTDIIFNEYTGILDIEPSGIVMENGDFELNGSIDTKNDVNLDLYFKGTKPNFDLLIAFAPDNLIPVLNKYTNAGDIFFNASIKGPANKGNRPKINVNFGADKAFLENTIREKKIDKMGFKGHFSNGANRDMNTMEFSLTDLRASIDKGDFEGSLYVKNFESPEVKMQLDADFSIDFMTDFLELDQVQNTSGQVSLRMNFHDIIDIEHPEKALQKLNQAYFAELKVNNLHIESETLPAPIDNMNVHIEMNGKEAILDQFDVLFGNSDISVTGYLSDLPAVVHHTEIPVDVHLDINSRLLDIAQLTKYTKQDTISSGIDERIKNLSLGLSFKTSAKKVTESEYLPEGTFYIDSLNADLKHYPHKLHDFHADIVIDKNDFKIKDFTGYIDDSDFHIDGLIHDYAFWMQPDLNGDVDLDLQINSQKIRLEDLFTYKGENYVPSDYRHEIFDDMALHFTSSMHYKNSHLHSIDVELDQLNAKMELHPLRFESFKGSLHYEDDHVMVTDFHGEIGKTNFDLDLNYYLGDDQEIKKRDNVFAIKANYIDFDALFDFNLESSLITEEKDANKTRSTDDALTHASAFNLYELPFTDMQFKADINHFIYHQIDLQNIKADLRTTPNHFIYVDTLAMNAAGGKIELNGYFNGSDPTHIYLKPDLNLINVDLDKLLLKFENFGQDHIVSENLQGKLTSSIQGNIRVYPDMVPDLDQSTLTMDVQVLNGRLKEYDPMLVLSDYIGDKNLKNIRFDTLQNSLKVEKGKIEIPAMNIESTLGHIELSGTHDRNQNIDYYIRIPWNTVRKAAWQKVFGSKKDSISNEVREEKIIEIDPNKKVKYLNVKIKGTIDDYKVTLGKKKE